MSHRKTALFYVILVAVASMAVGMVIASRLDLSSSSSAQSFSAPAMNSAPLTGGLDAATFRNVAATASPSVVNIQTESKRRAQQLEDFFGEDLFRRFFGQPQPRQPREQTLLAAGSGFIIGKDGYILTNNHVVEDTTRIVVSLYNPDPRNGEARTYEATVIGRDPLTDSALIKLKEAPKEPLPEAKFGDSSVMKPGDWVVAIGNPFGYGHTVTVGVISAAARQFPVADRRYQDVLQTDAAINPGNSGGPLLNVRGEVVGINTAIATESMRPANIGIGFAMPINVVRNILPELRTGKVVRGQIAVSIRAVEEHEIDELGLKERRGALVSSVTRGGPADRAGIEPGDVILEYNGKPVRTTQELVNMVVATKPGTTVPVRILRDKKEMSLNVTVQELDLEAESGRSAERTPPEEAGGGFGLQLEDLSPRLARQLGAPQGLRGVAITDVDPDGPARRAGIAPGDIILRVNRQPVETAAEASRLLQAVPSRGTAFLLIWRQGEEIFVTVRKP